MSFSKDALIHKLQDEIDAFCRDNIVIPIVWKKDEEGKAVYDYSFIYELFEKELDRLWSQDERKG